MALERLGVPTVVVAHESFAFAAETQAKLMELPELPIAVMPRPEPDWTDDRVAEVIDDLAKQVQPALTGARPIPVPRG